MTAMTAPVTIYGPPCDRWPEVQNLGGRPFIYIASNGSRFAGSPPATVAELLEVLEAHPLDMARFGESFVDFKPVGHRDLKPLFPLAPGTVSFWGNFTDLSHVFSLYTNHRPTVDRLLSAITANVNRQKNGEPFTPST